ncbi:MAG: M55 family metallopeptidase [Candidatus Eremiobacteraeota bacterium]|nr:M55 family metallopeptidase [Candidatus Eremiobacteraeota bacterium]
MNAGSKSPTIFVSIDMEGCATLVHWDEVRPSSSAEYRRAQTVMTSECNAVIDGAFAAGAGRVIVNDSHSAMRNLLLEDLDARADVIGGRIKRDYMLQGLTHECAASFFIGYHGAIGDGAAVMGHTYSPRVIYECRLNDVPVSELPINAAFAGHFGVPVALVSGDATTVSESKRVLPWAFAVQTKESLSYYAADCRSPHDVCDELRRKSKDAVEALGAFAPLHLECPIDMEIDTMRTSHADMICLVPGFERRGPRTVGCSAPDALAMYRALTALIYVGAAA